MGKRNPAPEIGRRFGHLVVIDNKQHTGKHNLSACMCQCDCGNITITPTSDLVRGHSKSCGCRTGILKIPHETVKGESGTRLYKTWTSIIARCYVPSHKSYKYYGGRGISMCKEWRENYQPFKQWALENGYNDSLTIDRIDVNGNYEPSNCRWATMVEQQNNRRSNRYLTFNGKTMTIANWAREIGVSRKFLEQRIFSGWSTERALTEPSHYHRKETITNELC